MKENIKDRNLDSIKELINQAILQSEKGNFLEAEKIYIKIIDLNENYLLAYYNLLQINEELFDDKKFKKVKKILNYSSLTDYEKSIGNFIISVYQRRRKKIEKEIYYLNNAYLFSFKSKEKINRQSDFFFRKIMPSFYDKKKYIVNNDIIKDNFSYNPIFIIGLPRTGSTLIESILSSSKEKIPTFGESFIFNSTIVELLQKNQNIFDPKFQTSNFEFNIDYDLFSKKIKKKYEDFNLFDKKKNFYFIDKSLENFFYIDLILDLFPNAKFINCKRNLFHTSIAIYQKFLIHLGWAHSYRNILDYINNYLNVIEFYKKKFPEKIFDLELENLTKQSEKRSRDVFDFCNIKWDINSLAFYKRKNLQSKTASTKQIREKIYNYDKNKFEPYKDLAIKFSNEFSWLKKYF